MLKEVLIWKTISDFPMYSISESGDIYSSYRSGRILSPKFDKDGYKAVSLSKDGQVHHLRVHRLVAMVFLENPHNFPIVNHKDLNVTNNHISNLEWCTYTHNTVHYFANSSEKKGLSSLSKEELLTVIDMYKSGKSQKQVAAHFGLDCRADAITELVTGRRFSEITGVVRPEDFKQRTTAKITDQDVLDILEKVHINNIPQKDICDEYGLSPAQVSRMTNGSRRRLVYEEFMSKIKEHYE